MRRVYKNIIRNRNFYLNIGNAEIFGVAVLPQFSYEIIYFSESRFLILSFLISTEQFIAAFVIRENILSVKFSEFFHPAKTHL